MRRAVSVGVVLLLATLFFAADASAQSRERAKPQLGQNYPNPFNPTTTIVFELPEHLFEGGRTVVVSIRIRTVLGAFVAYPLAKEHPQGVVEVRDLVYSKPGQHHAYWEGTDRFGRKVGSGIYLQELIVNGERAPPKTMVVAK